jgi:hypothetical protein
MAVAGVIVLLAVGAASALVVRDVTRRDCRFSEVRWDEAKREPRFSNERFEAFHPLAEQLVECEDNLHRRSRQAVRAMLGPPARGYSSRDEWGYEIGVPDPRSDYSPLTVRFDDDGLVDRVSVPSFIEP